MKIVKSDVDSSTAQQPRDESGNAAYLQNTGTRATLSSVKILAQSARYLAVHLRRTTRRRT